MQKFYGDSTHWGIGVVEDIQDPLNQGRVRVRIHGLHTFDTNKLAAHQLPWSGVAIAANNAGTSGVGQTPTGLVEGSFVFGIFLDGADKQDFLVTNALTGTDTATARQGQLLTNIAESLYGESNPERMYSYFRDILGFTEEEAAGALGAVAQFMGSYTLDNVDVDHGEGRYGLGNWDEDATAALRAFASGTAKDYTQFDTQLLFLGNGLQHSDSWPNYSEAGQQLGAFDASQAADSFATNVLGLPLDQERRVRHAHARQAMDAYGSSTTGDRGLFPERGAPTDLVTGTILPSQEHVYRYIRSLDRNIAELIVTDTNTQPGQALPDDWADETHFLITEDGAIQIGTLANQPVENMPAGSSVTADGEMLPADRFTTSTEMRDQIKTWEGLRLEPYVDAYGYSIGYGYFIGTDDQPELFEAFSERWMGFATSDRSQISITRAQADELFDETIERFENVVKNAVSVDITQSQFDALVAFTYNLGGFSGAQTLIGNLNSGNYAAAADAFPLYVNYTNMDGERIRSDALYSRRLVESEYFRRGMVGVNGIALRNHRQFSIVVTFQGGQRRGGGRATSYTVEQFNALREIAGATSFAYPAVSIIGLRDLDETSNRPLFDVRQFFESTAPETTSNPQPAPATVPDTSGVQASAVSAGGDIARPATAKANAKAVNTSKNSPSVEPDVPTPNADHTPVEIDLDTDVVETATGEIADLSAPTPPTSIPSPFLDPILGVVGTSSGLGLDTSALGGSSLTEAEVQALIDGSLVAYYTSAQVDTLLTSYYTSAQVDTLLAARDELGELTDVTLTSPSTGQYLRYNGADWVNATINYSDITGTPGAGDFIDHTNGVVNTRTVTSGIDSGTAAFAIEANDPIYFQTADGNHIRSLIAYTSADSTIAIGQGSTAYIGQIDLRPGNAGTATVNNNRILTVADEGAGNGLDADLLDGLDSTQFLRSDQNDVSSGNLTAASLRTSTGDIQLGSGQATGGQAVAIIGQTGDRIYIAPTDQAGSYQWGKELTYDPDGLDAWNVEGGLYVDGNAVWHTGNDGAGSGLDADLLDGIQSSQFVRNDINQDLTNVITFTNLRQADGITSGTDYRSGSIFPAIYSREDVIALKDVVNIEYWNGSSWVAWSGGASVVAALLDGTQSAAIVPVANSRFRFTVNAGTWLSTPQVYMSRQWNSSISSLTLTVERDADSTMASPTQVATWSGILGSGTYHWGGYIDDHNGEGWYRFEIEFNSPSVDQTLASLSLWTVYGRGQAAALNGTPFDWDSSVVNTPIAQLNVDGNRVLTVADEGSGNGLDADLLDGLHASSFVRGDNVDNGATTIVVNDADFILADATDATANWLWRDHSAGLLYIGTPTAAVTFRSDVSLNSNDITGVGNLTSSGDLYVTVDDADYAVRDTTDATTNFIFRDHSLSRLYLGTPAAEVYFRSDINTNGYAGYFESTANQIYIRETDAAVDAKQWGLTAQGGVLTLQSRDDSYGFIANLIEFDRSGGMDISGDVIVQGDLTVNGTTTTLNTTELDIEDNIITLNSGVTGVPSLNAGIEVERGTSANVAFRWNESTDKWQGTSDGSNYYDVLFDDGTAAGDAATLDGLDSSQFIRSDLSDKIWSGNAAHGYIQTNPSTASSPSYFSFHEPAGTRRGYIGWNSAGRNEIRGESGFGWVFGGTEAVFFQNAKGVTIGSSTNAIDQGVIFFAYEPDGLVTEFQRDTNGDIMRFDGASYNTLFGMDGSRTYIRNDSLSRGMALGVNSQNNFRINAGGNDFAWHQNDGTRIAYLDTNGMVVGPTSGAINNPNVYVQNGSDLYAQVMFRTGGTVNAKILSNVTNGAMYFDASGGFTWRDSPDGTNIATLSTAGVLSINGSTFNIGDGSVGNSIAMLSSTTGSNNILMGDTVNTQAGRIQYDNSTNQFNWTAGGTNRMSLNGSGLALESGSRVSSILDEDTMSSNSATALATQQSIKAYVDSAVSGGTGDAGTLDGLDSSQFLRSDQNDTLSTSGNTVLTIESLFTNSSTNGLMFKTVGDSSASRITYQKSGVTQAIRFFNHAATNTDATYNDSISGKTINEFGYNQNYFYGNLEINTSNATLAFRVTSDTHSARINYLDTAGNLHGSIQYDVDDDYLRWYSSTTASEWWRFDTDGLTLNNGQLHVIDSSGEGTPTTSPFNLVVQDNNTGAGGNALFLGGSSGTPALYFGDFSNTYDGGFAYRNADRELGFRASNAERMTLSGSELDITVDTHITGNVAIGNTVQSNRALYVYKTASSATDSAEFGAYNYIYVSGTPAMTSDQNKYGSYNRASLSDSSTTADSNVATLHGTFGYAQIAAGHSDNMYGVQGLAHNNGGADSNAANAYGGNFEVRLDNTGSVITNAYGMMARVRTTSDADGAMTYAKPVRAYLDHDGTSTIANVTLFEGVVDIEALTGTITHLYGMHLNLRDNFDGTVTNRRGIWVEGPDTQDGLRNHINGHTVFGGNSASFATNDAVVHIDDNEASGAGLYVTGGGGGSYIARFQRDVGSTGIIDIHCSAGDPTISFDNGSTGTKDWSIAATSASILAISEDSSPSTDPLLYFISGSGMSLRNNNWLYFQDTTAANTMNIGTSGNSMYLQNYYAGGDIAMQLAGSNTTGSFFVYDSSGNPLFQIASEHGRQYNYSSGASATFYDYYYNNDQHLNNTTTHASYYSSRSSDGNYEYVGSRQWVGEINTAGSEQTHVRDYIMYNGALMETVRQTYDFTQISTASGYVEIGPQNGGWCHFSTDRDKFYMNKPLHATTSYTIYNTNNVWSNGDLHVENASGTTEIRAESTGAYRARVSVHGGGTGYTTADILLEDDSASTIRGMGTYMYNRASGEEWFIGQPYAGDENDFAICHANQLNGDEGQATADISNAEFRIDADAQWLYLAGKEAIRYGDGWLRLNNSQSFASGIYCGSSIVRTDGQLQVGSSGATFYANSTAVHASVPIRTTSSVRSGEGSGGVCLTVNDGYGNANVCFNHEGGVPEQTGNAARIEVNTDSTTDATMSFEIGTNVTSGVATGLTSVMEMRTTGLKLLDSKILSLGSSNDMEIFHNGTANYIDLNNGSLYIRESTTTRFTFARTSGDFTATGNVTANSDRNLKDILSTVCTTSTIDNLQVYNFLWKSDGKASRGVIAQEVEEYAPWFVVTGENGVKSVDYGKLATAAVYEEKKKREALEEKVEKLEAMVEMLMEKLNGSTE